MAVPSLLLLLSGPMSAASPARTAATVRLATLPSMSLTHEAIGTLGPLGDVMASANPVGGDGRVDLALAFLPMGRSTGEAVRTRDSDLTLAATTTIPIAASTRSGFDLDTTALGTGGPVRARFMGLEASGRRFCIIADRSGSMRFGAKIEHLKAEILKTVGDLRGGARFYVILFGDTAEAIPSPRWLGGREDVARTEAWLRSVDAQGGTYPLPAFESAFRMNPRPDAIFFMTDGLFPVEVAPAVKQLNGTKHRIPIHTISFFDQSAEFLLRQIAAQSGGSYRHVPGF